ncbi:MAG: hypothetical protein M0R17_05235 [Candidatus Omnitrophica bacterium]|nr:hypothetical protein [Candidatus Omnitrophota bacterium]
MVLIGLILNILILICHTYKHIVYFVWDCVTRFKRPKDIRRIIFNNNFIKYKLDISFRNTLHHTYGQIPLLMVCITEIEIETNEVVYGTCYLSLF